jgi:hypothetical protein
LTKLLRLLFKFESEYVGSPQYIPGNSLRHALSLQLNTSIGIFTTTSILVQPQTYYEFFLLRTKKCFLRPYFELWWDQVHYRRSYRCFFLPQFVTFDIIKPPENVIDIIKEKELLQFGGKRTTGCGIVTLQDYREIDLDKIVLPDTATHLTLISPSVYFPPFVEPYSCRHKHVKLWNHSKVNIVNAIAPGQFFRIKSERRISKIAKKGIIRKMALGQFGFGEFILHNWRNN